MRPPGLPLLLLLGVAAAAEPQAPSSGPDQAAPPPGPGPAAEAPTAARQEPFVRRPLLTRVDGRWYGQGVCYGPHRDGQRPGGPAPTRDQLREDLRILAGRFTLLRLHGADEVAERVLSLISDEELPFKVLLGASVAPEARPTAAAPLPGDAALTEAAAGNRAQVETALRLAKAYPELILALLIGHESQLSRSAHRLPPETLIPWLRRARAGTTLPVGTAGDLAFWRSPEGGQVAREVDFVALHAQPMWSEKPQAEALAFTQGQYAEVARRLFGVPVVLGAAGWATAKGSEGDQATLIQGEPGEEPQRLFFEQFTRWVVAQHVTSTWFEAFDEGWKSGPHPDDVEKHWGLWRADRTPKAAVEKYPLAGP